MTESQQLSNTSAGSVIPGINNPEDCRPGWDFACLVCHQELERIAPDCVRCPNDGSEYCCTNGIWRFLPPERQEFYVRFLREYSEIRMQEGRSAADPLAYRMLPDRGIGGGRQDEWRMRAASYRTFYRRVYLPFLTRWGRPLEVLDLGAGNGWLSYQMALRGNRVASVDLLDNDFDGLGCWRYYDAGFSRVQAEFDHLPFLDESASLVIFNASLHYSTDYSRTLTEALRVLAPGGRLVILDSPLYHDQASGVQMVAERRRRFTHLYGFASDALPSQEYLTWSRLAQLGAQFGLAWRIIPMNYGLRWQLRSWWAQQRLHRETAQFAVITTDKLVKSSNK